VTAPSRWRYVPPNAVTALSIVFGVIAIQTAVQGRPVSAAWWGLLVMLTDKLDGTLAGLLKAQSGFGVQLDSLADLVAFGVVPSVVYFTLYWSRPELGWTGTGPSLALRAICCLYTVAVALRLARFNVLAQKGPIVHYTGITSTMTAGVLMSMLLAVLKYADSSHVAPEHLDRWRLLGGLSTEALLPYMPFTLLLGAVGMLSSLRVPKLGRTFHPAVTVILLIAVGFGYAMGLARRLPEYLFGGGLYYLGICVAYHLRTRGATSSEAPAPRA
jgi:CDP-diacylglycerol--serine O-phosphatidyltransferase